MDEKIGSTFLTYKKYKESRQNIVLLCSNIYKCQKSFENLSTLIPKEDIIVVPDDELIRAEYISESKDILAQKIFAINEMLNSDHKIYIISPSTFYKYYPSKTLYVESSIRLKVGEIIEIDTLTNKLQKAGYYKVNKIDQSLQFAVRGDVLDFYSLNYDLPIRIEFFGDEIESIRLFDIGTQVSVSSISECNILPATLNLLNASEKASINEKIMAEFDKIQGKLSEHTEFVLRAQLQEDIEILNENVIDQKLYKYYGFLQDKHYSILDFLTNYIVINASEEEFENSSKLLMSEANEFLLELFEDGKSLANLSYFNASLSPNSFGSENYIFNQFYLHEDSINIPLRPIMITDAYKKNNELLLKEYIEQNYDIFITLENKVQRDKIQIIIDDLLKDYKFSGTITFELLNYYVGVESKEKQFVILTTKELFGKTNSNSLYSSRFREGVILGSYQELDVGDYVVHESYGIGQYVGIQTKNIGGKNEDYLEIKYNKGDTLFVPLYSFNLIRKYVGREGNVPKLNSLSGGQWSKTKQKIKEKVNDLADRLLVLYQDRARVKGFQFAEDEELQRAFEADFKHSLTKDQESSLREIKDDMESEKPMDRLLCGDVGFGKTEIAFRAAFKAILSGKQACLLCPTTLLAKQHYEVSLVRFKNFDIKIAILTRFNSPKEVEDIKNRLALGKIDLLIGTHKVLGKSVVFNELGLLIIDEEQRFGVEQKEKIKELKNNLDVLTLSATPIPRTLQSSLIGLKSVSTIQTPPKERIPIQTYVVPFDPRVVKELILREMGREGQIYYIHNNTYTIYSRAQQIMELIPECRIGVVHGQMPKNEINLIMTQFYQGDIDLLMATSIIENGIDVRNANLILVENADRFGLAQLYQIKGRVGRGNRMAFAYLMVDPKRELKEISRKRLKAIQDFTELGSGYKIAQRDLLIRGAGDILGPQQAGFIDDIGIDLYLKLLNEAVEEKKSGIIKKKDEVPLNLHSISGYIPNEFANDSDKIELYQKLLEVKDLFELEHFKKTIRDMYGSIPEAMSLLIIKRELDLRIKNPAFEGLKEYETRIALFLSNEFSNIEGIGTVLFTSLIKYIKMIKITYINKSLQISIDKKDNWLEILLKVISIIEELYQKHQEGNSIYEN